MQEIGGYFGLELSRNTVEYYENAIRINNARNSLRVILKLEKIKRIFLPFYTCDVVLEPIKKENKKFYFYHLNEDLSPKFNFNELNEDDLFIYVNYFGICNSEVEKIIEVQKKRLFRLAIDSSQAFFSEIEAARHIYSFNSARKFFGVPDGSYLFGISNVQDLNLKKEISYLGCEHLLSRLDCSASFGYGASAENDRQHSNKEIAYMSNLSQNILKSIDYEYVKKQRLKNFLYLNKFLGKINMFQFDENFKEIPLVYPLLIENGWKLREYLIQNKVYVAKYWPNQKIVVDASSFEKQLTENLVAVPIDQRYTESEMQYILDLIAIYLEEAVYD